MATRTWLDVSGDLNSTSNYSSATKPSTGDVWEISSGNKSLTTATTEFAAVALLDVNVRSGFTGAFGATGTPIKFGAMTGKIYVDAPLASIVSLWPVSVPKIIIQDCNESPGGGCYIYDGTITDLIIIGGGYIRIGGLADGTNLHVLGGGGTHPSPQVYIEAGAAFTNLYCTGGVVRSYATFTNIECSGSGRVYLQGDAALSTTSIKAYNGGRVVPNTNGGTHTAITVWNGGTVDFGEDMRTKTITNCTANAGGSILGHTNITFTNAPVLRGGRVTGATALTVDADSIPFISG